MKISELKVDVVRQEQGDWVDNIPEMQGVRLKVRGTMNKDWRKLFQRLLEAVPRKKRPGGLLDPLEQDRITAICLRDCCLLDWEGFEDDEGKPLPYSKEQANEYLTNHRKFRDGVIWAASVVADSESAAVDEDAGN